MNITSIKGFSSLAEFNLNKAANLNKNAVQNPINNFSASFSTYPSNYFLSFGAKLPKDLISFSDRNTDTMPITVRSYIDSLSDEQKSRLKPLEAHYRAFEALELAQSVDDIKLLFPDEPLFNNLKSAQSSAAKRGILYDINLMKDDIFANDESILKTNEDLTVYLVRKIFMEGKTRAEINKDLVNDLNPVFVDENDPEKEYILSSTIRALGIKLPVEYLNSLRYTRKNYADTIGDKLRQLYKDLPEKEKQRRRDKLIEARSKLTDEQKQLISQNQSTAQKKRYSEMSEAELQALKENRKKSWDNLSAEEKTDRIEKMQTGQKRQKISMIAAWNMCPDIRIALSDYLSENNFYNPQNIIYRQEAYSQSMKVIMTKFWELNPDFSKQLGKAIVESYLNYDLASENGTVEDFEKAALEESERIKKEIKARAKDKNKRKVNRQAAQVSQESPAKTQEEIDKERMELVKKSRNRTNIFGKKYLFSIDYPNYKMLPKQFLADWDDYVIASMESEKDYLEVQVLSTNKNLSAEEKEWCAKIQKSKQEREVHARKVMKAFVTASMDEIVKSIAPKGIFDKKNETTSQRMIDTLYRSPIAKVADMLKEASNNRHITIFMGNLPSMIKVYGKPDYEKVANLYDRYVQDLTSDDKDFIINNLIGGVKTTDMERVRKEMEKALEGQGKYVLEIFNESKSPLVRMTLAKEIFQNSTWLNRSYYIRQIRKACQINN